MHRVITMKRVIVRHQDSTRLSHNWRLNFISWNKAYSWFPNDITVQRQVYTLKGPYEDLNTIFALQQAARIKTLSIDWSRRDSNPMTRIRHVGDKYISAVHKSVTTSNVSLHRRHSYPSICGARPTLLSKWTFWVI